MNPDTPQKFEKEWLLICEGVGDQRFFHRLFEYAQIDFVQVCKPEDGKSGIGRFLKGLRVAAGFDDVKGMIIVSDKDDNAGDSFQEICDFLKKAGFSEPQEERILTGEDPAVCVVLLPIDDETGNMENFCLKACRDKWNVEDDILALIEKTAAKDWSKGKRAKCIIQCTLAVTNQKCPDSGFAASWNAQEKYRIPIDHFSFAKLAAFIKGLPSLLDAET